MHSKLWYLDFQQMCSKLVTDQAGTQHVLQMCYLVQWKERDEKDVV